ncbi:hypothetical protein VTK73DRAFT_3652 [Phialemonium thermophilum]|uniref:Uncharacterized protein n=1 Tax=Phialemonium thermophilum TaxID=223376 RepID=A0ABR3WYN8_9PEZI
MPVDVAGAECSSCLARSLSAPSQIPSETGKEKIQSGRRASVSPGLDWAAGYGVQWSSEQIGYQLCSHKDHSLISSSFCNPTQTSRRSKMRFLAPLTLLIAAVYAAASDDAAAGQLAIAEIEPGVSEREFEATKAALKLKGRACVYNGCRCDSRGKQFHSCGNCVWTSNGAWVITKKRVADHIFECAPNGDCCDYGYAKDCGTSGARCYISG